MEKKSVPVLIVDDSRLAGMVTQKILKNNGFDSLHAGSAKALFGFKGEPGLLAENAPDSILLDIQMPEMNGIEVLRKLKARTDTEAVPVVMLTASADEGNVREALENGADGFLAKPVAPKKLFTELCRVAKKSGNTDLADLFELALGELKG